MLVFLEMVSFALAKSSVWRLYAGVFAAPYRAHSCTPQNARDLGDPQPRAGMI